ncbi:MAG: hypothetical protein ABJD11_16340 [Gemmatimonadota bacterium]
MRGDDTGQHAARAMDAAHDRADGNAGDVGNLLVTESLDIVQPEGRCKLLRYQSQDLVHTVGRCGAQQELQRILLISSRRHAGV